MNFTRYQSYIFPDESDLSLTAFSRKSSFATVVKFFNMIGLVLSSSLDLNKSIKIYMLFLLLSAVIDSIQGWIQKLFKAGSRNFSRLKLLADLYAIGLPIKFFQHQVSTTKKREIFSFHTFRLYVLIYAS